MAQVFSYFKGCFPSIWLFKYTLLMIIYHPSYYTALPEVRVCMNWWLRNTHYVVVLYWTVLNLLSSIYVKPLRVTTKQNTLALNLLISYLKVIYSLVLVVLSWKWNWLYKVDYCTSLGCPLAFKASWRTTFLLLILTSTHLLFLHDLRN